MATKGCRGIGPLPALEAADGALERRLAMADAIVYATARRFGATLVTADADFEDLPDVVLIR